jgi:hypothetical protein
LQKQSERRLAFCDRHGLSTVENLRACRSAMSQKTRRVIRRLPMITMRGCRAARAAPHYFSRDLLEPRPARRDRVEKARQPAPNDLLSLRHDAIDQLLHRRDVIDQADHHAAAQGARVHVTVDHDLRIDAGDLVVDIVDLQGGAFSRSISISWSTDLFLSTRSVFRRARITSRVSSSVASTSAFFTFG